MTSTILEMTSAEKLHDAGRFVPGLSDKLPEQVVVKFRPFFRRRWFRVTLFGLFIAAGVAGALIIARFDDWRDTQVADFEHQRQSLQSFLHSAEFTQFTQTMDAQFVALNNFIAARPQETRALLPAVAAHDQARHQLAWTSEIVPLPISAATNPAAVMRGTRELHRVLARHGYVADESVRKTSRQIFLRTLAPFAQTFLNRERGNFFNAIMLDRRMQEDALRRFAEFHGGTVTAAETERAFALYAAIGPAMWQAIEREHAQANRSSFAGLVR